MTVEGNLYQQTLEKAREAKSSIMKDNPDSPMNLVKGSAVGLLLGAGYGFFKKKNVYIYAVIGAALGGVVNAFLIPYVKDNA